MIRPEPQQCFDFDGVPQIPDALARALTADQSGRFEPTGELLDEAKEAIDAACRELRRRTENDRRREGAPDWEMVDRRRAS